MKLFKLYTENKNRTAIETLADVYLEGYTIYEGQGRFKGSNEPCIVIEVIANQGEVKEHFTKAYLRMLAQEICQLNNQLEVWITEQEIDLTIVEVKHDSD